MIVTLMKKSLKLLALAAFFVVELIVSSLRVAWDVLTPRAYRTPGIVALPLQARTDREIALVANLITLTPGSLSIDVSADRRYLYVHSMFVSDPAALIRALSHGYERQVLELVR